MLKVLRMRQADQHALGDSLFNNFILLDPSFLAFADGSDMKNQFSSPHRSLDVKATKSCNKSRSQYHE